MLQDKTSKSDHVFALTVTLIFLSTSLFFIQYHEMWRDELQAWLLARDSSSIIDLFANLKYEAHPGLWHIFLYPLSRLFPSPEIMQLLHVFIASLSVYFFVAFAPFTKFQKALMPFGYFFIYEYTQLSRCYSLGILLAFIICALYPHRYKKQLLIAFFLFLLCHTSVFWLIVAISFTIAFFFDYQYINKSYIDFDFKRKTLLSVIIIFIGITSSIIHIIPPADHGFFTKWHFNLDIKRIVVVADAIFSAYLPLPKFQQGFWNSKLIYDSSAFGILFALVFIILFIFLNLRSFMCRPAAIYFFLSTFLGTCMFFYVKWGGYIRHHGFLFLALIIAMWIARNSNARKYKTLPKRSELKSIFFVRHAFNVFLIIHLLSGAEALFLDYKHQFSGAKQTAQYIASKDIDELLLIGLDTHSLSVIGYLTDKDIYYLRSRRFGTFTIWDKKRNNPFDELSLYEATRMIGSTGQSGLFILHKPLLWPEKSGLTIKKIYETSTTIRQDEQFFVYRFFL